MTGLVASFRATVDPSALVSRINRDRCSVSVCETPEPRIIVDFDNPASGIRKKKRHCDYLFVSGRTTPGWIIPIELKSGRFRNQHAVDQLQGGADFAAERIPAKTDCRFAAVIAHGQPVGAAKRRELRHRPVHLHSKRCLPYLLACEKSLSEVFVLREETRNDSPETNAESPATQDIERTTE